MNKILAAYYILTLVFLYLFALYDYRHHRIRNTALVAFLPWCLCSVPVTMLSEPLLPWYYALLTAILGGISGFLILLFAALITNGGIGGGDIKLVALLGIPFGTAGLLAVLFLSCVAAMLALVVKKYRDKWEVKHIPFAPYLFVGALLYTLPQLIR